MAEDNDERIILSAPCSGRCEICGVKHAADRPHCLTSAYYRMHFRQENGREPTWEDAMEHCPESVKKRERKKHEK